LPSVYTAVFPLAVQAAWTPSSSGSSASWTHSRCTMRSRTFSESFPATRTRRCKRSRPCQASRSSAFACSQVRSRLRSPVGRDRLPPKARRRGDLWLICSLATAAPVGLAIYSSLGTDIWDARDLYPSVPAGVLVLGALLAAIPFRLRLIAVAAVLATLIAGTIRAISPRYARPPFGAAASYLDRVAGPRDPIIMYPSFLGLDADLPIGFQKPHPVINGIPVQWPPAQPGRFAVAVLDGHIGGAAGTPIPRPRGYELVTFRQYGGLLPFMLLIYRPVGPRPRRPPTGIKR